jgi:tetratricopeptide (TPR) repeat protein
LFQLLFSLVFSQLRFQRPINETRMRTFTKAPATTAFLLSTLACARAMAGVSLEQQELAAVSPEAAALVDQAHAAARAGHAKEAWELFGRAWPLAPRSPLPSRGICRLSLALGIETESQWKAARAACQSALMLGGTHEDLHNKLAADLFVNGKLKPTMEAFVTASADADGAVRMSPVEPWGYAARGDLAFWLGDRALLESSLSDLRRVAPDHAETRRVTALSRVQASPWI